MGANADPMSSGLGYGRRECMHVLEVCGSDVGWGWMGMRRPETERQGPSWLSRVKISTGLVP